MKTHGRIALYFKNRDKTGSTAFLKCLFKLSIIANNKRVRKDLSSFCVVFAHWYPNTLEFFISICYRHIKIDDVI